MRTSVLRSTLENPETALTVTDPTVVSLYYRKVHAQTSFHLTDFADHYGRPTGTRNRHGLGFINRAGQVVCVRVRVCVCVCVKTHQNELPKSDLRAESAFHVSVETLFDVKPNKGQTTHYEEFTSLILNDRSTLPPPSSNKESADLTSSDRHCGAQLTDRSLHPPWRVRAGCQMAVSTIAARPSPPPRSPPPSLLSPPSPPQSSIPRPFSSPCSCRPDRAAGGPVPERPALVRVTTVSYTHLTLPTNAEV